jgi:hypothetical protein
MIHKWLISILFLMIHTSVFSQNPDKMSEFIIHKKAHPYSLTIKFENLTQDVLDEIKKTYTKPALRAMTKKEATDTRLFLEKNDFIPMRTTWLGEIDVSKINVEPFEKALNEVKKQQCIIDVVPESLMSKWLMHHKNLYDVSHSINPLAPLTETDIIKIFKGDDFVADLAFAVYRDTLIIAHGSIRKNKLDWDFGWFGATQIAENLSSETLNLAIKALEIRAAKKLGIEKMYVEYDSTDGQAMMIMRHLPITNPEIWITYQNKIAVPFID